MMSLERDEEYMPTFKSCVKDTVTDIMAGRQKLADEGRNKGLNYSLVEGDKFDFLVDRGLDEIKLSEVAEHEIRLWGPLKDKVTEAWKNYGKEPAAIEEPAAET